MEACDSEQALQKQTRIPSVNKNGVQTREVGSRYRPSSPTASTRCSSPIATRALSAERKRPSTSSSTPLQDTAPRKLSESLWPSTMRNLTLSFQSDTSVPSKIDTPDRTLRHSPNVASRKPTPERMQSPRRGKHATHQSHNSKPVDSYLHHQHPWPTTTTGKVSTSIHLADNKSKISSSTPSLKRLSLDRIAVPNTSLDLGDKMSKLSSFSRSDTVSPSRRLSRNGTAGPNRSFNPNDKASNVSSLSCSPSLRRLSLVDRSIDSVGNNTSKTSPSSHLEISRIPSLAGTRKPLNKSTSDLLKLVSHDVSGKTCSADETSLQTDSSSSSDRTQTVNSAARTLSIPTLGLFPLSSLLSRWTGPSKEKLPTSSRVPSPARVRPSSPTKKLQTSNSVLSFLTDIKLLKRTSNHIEDVHHLPLLYNRLLQWRYANAKSDAALQSQKVKTQQMLCSVWMNIAALWDSISEKRVEIQRLRLKLKLYSVLDNQVFCLEEWALTERDHVGSLRLAIQDLQTNTVRVPVIRGASGDVESIKAAVWSAVDVMQAIGSSLCSIISKVERRKWLVSEVCDVVIQSGAMFDECESILWSILALQAEENSLRSHLLQIKQACGDRETSIFG